VVWKEATKSVIHSVPLGSVSPIVLKDCAKVAWSHLPATTSWAEGVESRSACRRRHS
jgi:hypothetical protein